MVEREIVLFEERQGWGRPRLWTVVWLVLAVALIAAAAAVGMKWHWGWGAAGILGGAMVGAAAYARSSLVVRVTRGRIVIRGGPGTGMTLGMDTVAGWEVCAVLPRVKIGTAGERGEGRVFLTGSLSAIEIQLIDGGAVLIGSRHVKNFLAALEQAKLETVRISPADAPTPLPSSTTATPTVS